MSMTPTRSAAETVMVPLGRIPTEEGAQTRPDPRRLGADYAAAIFEQTARGTCASRSVVRFTDGQSYSLGDGFHRLLAARHAGLADRNRGGGAAGTQRDAVLFGISANRTHAPASIWG